MEIMCTTEVEKINLPNALMIVSWKNLKNSYIPGQGLGVKLDGIVEPI